MLRATEAADHALQDATRDLETARERASAAAQDFARLARELDAARQAAAQADATAEQTAATSQQATAAAEQAQHAQAEMARDAAGARSAPLLVLRPGWREERGARGTYYVNEFSGEARSTAAEPTRTDLSR